MSKHIITIAVIAAAFAAPVAAFAAPTASTIAGADAAAIAIAGADKAAIALTPDAAAPLAAAPGFYIHTQRIAADTIKKTVYDYGAGAIAFVPPAPQKSMPSVTLAGMPDKSAALKLIRAVSAMYRHAGKPFVAAAECVSAKGHRYAYSFVYTPHATGHRDIWQNVNGNAVTKMIADKCPASDLIISINPAK